MTIEHILLRIRARDEASEALKKMSLHDRVVQMVQGVQIRVNNELEEELAAWNYAARVEYGFPPPDPNKTVEGSIALPVTDPARLIEKQGEQ